MKSKLFGEKSASRTNLLAGSRASFLDEKLPPFLIGSSNGNMIDDLPNA